MADADGHKPQNLMRVFASSVNGEHNSMHTTLTKQQIAERRVRARAVLAKFKKLFPGAKTALHWRTPWELLVSVILSAQCTDKKVNEVTARLFKKYRTLDAYVLANRVKFEKDIYQTGFYRNKAKNILAAAKMVKKHFNGKIPRTMKEILELPGVARKTANVVLGNAFGIIEGIAVDTHVRRLAYQFGLTDHKDPKKIERDLMAIIPKKDWLKATHLFIEYGRAYPPRLKTHRGEPLEKFYR